MRRMCDFNFKYVIVRRLMAKIEAVSLEIMWIAPLIIVYPVEIYSPET